MIIYLSNLYINITYLYNLFTMYPFIYEINGFFFNLISHSFLWLIFKYFIDSYWYKKFYKIVLLNVKMLSVFKIFWVFRILDIEFLSKYHWEKDEIHILLNFTMNRQIKKLELLHKQYRKLFSKNTK